MNTFMVIDVGLKALKKKIEITPNSEDKEKISGEFCPVRPKEIKIFCFYSNGKEKNSASYYGTTIHELAHSAHCEYVGLLNFLATNDNVCDTWAVGVQDFFSFRKYREYGRLISHGSYGRQYTGLVNDLRDTGNEDLSFLKGSINDGVSGYSLLDVQKALLGITNWTQFRDHLKNIKSIDNETSKNIDALFDFWANY